MIRSTALYLLSIVLLCLKSAAQQAPLSDTWILFDEVGISGFLYSNALPKMTKIDVGNDRIYFENLDMNTLGLDTTIRDTCNLGNLYTRQYRANRFKQVESKLSPDGKSLETVTLIFPDTQKSTLLFRITSVYRMDGHRMILQRKFENKADGDSWECRGVFEKRDDQ